MKINSAKIHKYFFLIGCTLILGACKNTSPTIEGDTGLGRPKDLLESMIAESDSVIYDLTYVGVLPCKDCVGIKTTLKLSTKENKFSLKEEFLKTDIAPSLLTGHFNTERGFEKDEDATLYVLCDELPEIEHVYFLRETAKNDILTKLDHTKQKTNNPDFELKKLSQ